MYWTGSELLTRNLQGSQDFPLLFPGRPDSQCAMPLVDLPLKELEVYTGISPRPADFDAYWARALQELDATDPAPVLTPTEVVRGEHLEAFDLYFTGVGGARVYTKLIKPKAAAASPALLHFHGYSGNSGDWISHLPYVVEGMTVAAMDCRGQGGRSEDLGSVRGNTMRGHIIRGLDEESPDKLLFRSHFLDTVQLARVVASLPWVDGSKLACAGGSQGGGLSIACASLEPKIKKCVSIFPFLSDYLRVWKMDLAKDAYEELKLYFRLFDPRHEREAAVFERLGYIDVHNLAPRIEAEVLMGLSLMDTVCPPSTQFAVYNSIGSPKRNLIYPDFAHEGLPGFQDAAFNFLTDWG